MTWYFFDPVDGKTIILDANDATGLTADITWIGNRKGGDRWYALDNLDLAGWTIDAYRPFPSSGLPISKTTLQVPSTPGNWAPFGLANDKHGFMVASQDSTGTAADQFTFYDYAGNIIREVLCSDAPDRMNKQCVFLEHDYYVLSEAFETAYQIKKYDARGNLILTRALFGIIGIENASGITTDGKHLYVSVSTQPTSRILKYGVDGKLLRIYNTPGDNLAFEQGITFNGRYIVCRLQILPPP